MGRFNTLVTIPLRNIPILPMESLTLAEAKVWSAPPFVHRNHIEAIEIAIISNDIDHENLNCSEILTPRTRPRNLYKPKKAPPPSTYPEGVKIDY